MTSPTPDSEAAKLAEAVRLAASSDNKERAARLLDAYGTFPTQHLASIIAFEAEQQPRQRAKEDGK